MVHNSKINKDGSYRKFYGWTIISHLISNFKFIENFISHNEILNKYYSALPASSYHLTIYNIWSNGKGLLNHQKQVLKNKSDKLDDFTKQALIKGKFFNPHNCINDLLYRLYYECNKNTWNNIEIKIKNITVGNTLQIVIDEINNDRLNDLRKKATDICERDDKMKCFHITLAYKYKKVDDLDVDRVKYEITVLNTLLTNQKFQLGKPVVCSFENMKKFTPI